MNERLLLDEPQRELLLALVEAERSIPRERRGKFFVSSHIGSSLQTFTPSNGGPKVEGSLRDAEDLAARGLLSQSFGSRGTPQFWVSPEGFAYSSHLRSSETPVETIEESVRAHLSSIEFKGRHPDAFRKWSDAEALLWAEDSVGQLSTIGHLCRESMQLFAASFARELGAPVARSSRTVQNIREALDTMKPGGGQTSRAFLEALLAYWGCVSDLVQRQEHAAEREGGGLVWEDARRVVFQTLIVMFELSRSVNWREQSSSS